MLRGWVLGPVVLVVVPAAAVRWVGGPRCDGRLGRGYWCGLHLCSPRCRHRCWCLRCLDRGRRIGRRGGSLRTGTLAFFTGGAESTVLPAAQSPPASAFSSIVEIIHPQSLALRTGMPGGGFRADRAATSGNGVPLRLPPCGALRQWIRARHDAPPRGADALAGEAFRGRGRGCCSSGPRGPFSGQQRSALPRHGGFQWAPMVNLAILCAATTTDSPVQASQALRRVA